METHSEAFLRKRRFYLVLPLLILPFLTLAFWALGGGKNTTVETSSLSGKHLGLSLELPKPRFKEGQVQNKLSLYEQAKRRLQKQKGNSKSTTLSPLGFGGERGEETLGAWDVATSVPVASNPIASDGQTKPLTDPNEEKINQRLAQLSTLVHSKPEPPGPTHRMQALTLTSPIDSRRFSQDVDRLEALMHTVDSDGATNPEMQQLENMLERILDIQHPERVKDKSREQDPETQLHALNLVGVTGQADVTLLEASPQEVTASQGNPVSAPHPKDDLQRLEQNDFHRLSGAKEVTSETGNVIEAAIHETQTLTSGATVKIRLLQDVLLGGKLINKGSLLYGTCRINGQRLALEITSVFSHNTLLPVSLKAFDLDGLEGLFIPGSLARDAAKQSAGRVINQSTQLPVLSPSTGVQAASLGIEAARGLLSRQARQVKVTVKAGYRLLLRDEHP